MTNTVDTSRELRISRVYHAPRELVLKMWSDPDLISKWWGPHGFTTTTHRMDYRPGGEWVLTMHGPDGRDYSNRLCYDSIGSDRIEFTHYGDGETVHFLGRVTFEELGPRKTKMEFRMIFETAEERTRIVEEYGAGEGLAQTTTRLDILLGDVQMRANPFSLVISKPADDELKTVRSFRAPRELVFDAFTNAEHIRNWQGPRSLVFTESEFDARPGGKWHTCQVDSEGRTCRFFGDVIEVVRPEKLVMTFCFEEYDPQLETIWFEEVDGLTRVTNLTKFTDQANRDGMLESGMEPGLTEAFERLDDFLKAELEAV